MHAGTPGSNGDKDIDLEQIQPESMWAAPKEWCPNPNSTICFRVQGDSMSPLIWDGYIIAVDTSEVDHGQLAGKIVVAHNKGRGLIVSRLTRVDHTDVLMSDQRGHEHVSLAPESGWYVVGRELWWAGKAR